MNVSASALPFARRDSGSCDWREAVASRNLNSPFGAICMCPIGRGVETSITAEQPT